MQADYSKFKHGNVTWNDFVAASTGTVGMETSGSLYDKFLAEAKATLSALKSDVEGVIRKARELGDVRVCNGDASLTGSDPANRLFAIMCSASDFLRKVNRYETDLERGKFSGTSESSSSKESVMDVDNLKTLISQIGKDREREFDVLQRLLPTSDEVRAYREKYKFPSAQPLLLPQDIPKKWINGQILTRDVDQTLTLKHNFPTTTRAIPLRSATVVTNAAAPTKVEVVPGLSIPMDSRTDRKPRGLLVAVVVIIIIIVVCVVSVVLFVLFKKDRESMDIVRMGLQSGMEIPELIISRDNNNNDNDNDKDRMNNLLNASSRMEHISDCPCGCMLSE
jgi:hypothetical protein